MPTMNLTPAECLVARWNATYPPGTPVTVRIPDGPTFEATTAGPADFVNERQVHIPVDSKSGRWYPMIQSIEHRTILDPATEQACRALGMPPLSELDPAPLLDLRAWIGERIGVWPVIRIPEEFDGRWLTIQQSIAGYITKLCAPPTQDQIEHIERHIAEYHGLPAVVWEDGEPWLAHTMVPKAVEAKKASWYVQFTFAHRFIPGTAQLCRAV